MVWGGGMNWIDRTQDRGMWRAVVSEIMNLHISLNAGNLLTSYLSVSFSGRTLLHGVGWLVVWLAGWLVGWLVGFVRSFFLSLILSLFLYSFVSQSVSYVVN